MKMRKIRQILAMFLCVLMVTNLAMPAMATATDSNAQQATEEVIEHVVLNTEAVTYDNESDISEVNYEDNLVVKIESDSNAQEQPEEIESDSNAQKPPEETTSVCETCSQEPCICEQTIIFPDVCEECGMSEGHVEDCSQYIMEEPVLSVAEKLLALDSIEEIYAVILDLMENNPDALIDLTAEEIEVLWDYINELDPEGKEADTQDLLDTLAVLPNGGAGLNVNPEGLVTITDATLPGDRFTSDSIQELDNDCTITMRKLDDAELAKRKQKANFVIPSGITVTFKGYGTFSRDKDNPLALIYVEEGGTLIIEGNSKEEPLIIDGNDTIADNPLIISEGTVELKNAVIQKGKNRSVSSNGTPNGNGGGIHVTADGSLTMDNSVVTRNTASLNGGGIYCRGRMTIANSTISYNVAASAETGPSVVNAGRGGGFDLVGEKAVGTLTNVIVGNNAAMYYGGGGQIQSGASLTMNDGTVFHNNTAILHGAGALHVTADAKFTMDGGIMENNSAQTVGGAIHSSYSCVLNLNSGKIMNNTANGRGGGVHVNTGGEITLGAGITISGNRANDEPTGSYADLDATGDNWSNVKKEGAHNNNGYGGGVLIDSGICTVEGATITNNSAAVGGGGIALVMLNVSDSGLNDVLVVNFKMTSGNISDNTTEGDGAGVYLMSNKAKENIIKNHGDEGTDGYNEAVAQLKDLNILTDIPVAEISGGIVSENKAAVNGGGLYLGEKTKFIIKDGEISSNEAVDGAGVYVASGTAEIHGGTMKSNAASQNGGALYISGDVTMTNGVLGTSEESDAENDANKAQNGGALYVADGDVKIEHGIISGNKADNGGAVYLAGNKDTMLAMESGEMKNNQAKLDGGAIYATSGTLTIGLEECLGTDETLHMHTSKDEGRHHPMIENNVAGDCGGGIAMQGLTDDEKGKGIVHFYCGQATDNEALYKGVGKNVFMYGGEFYLYDGADVGVPHDPDLVIIGGELHSMCDHTKHIKLKYYENNTQTGLEPYTGLATYESYMNLPEGEYFFEAPEGMRFIGWTPYGAESQNNSTVVRDKADYKPSGTSVQITDDEDVGTEQGTFDEEEDETMMLYAIWAPEVNNITFADSLRSQSVNVTSTYNIDVKEQTKEIQIPADLIHDGFEIVGWYIYQSEDKNGNWCDITEKVGEIITEAKSYEPVYTSEHKDYTTLNYEPAFADGGMKYYSLSDQNADLKLGENGNLLLKVPELTFGDIVLIPDYTLAYGDLIIEKKVAEAEPEPDQTFLFDIEKVHFDAIEVIKDIQEADSAWTLNTTLAVNAELQNLKNLDVEMEATIRGTGSTTVKHLPLGSYNVTEDCSWSWRYTPDETTKTAALSKNLAGKVEFTNSRTDKKWLDGSSWCQNIFASSTANGDVKGEAENKGLVQKLIVKKPDEQEIIFD